MQLDQTGDIRDEVIVEVQRLEATGGHLRPNHIVVVEADDATALHLLRHGFADVVQQRRHAQHQVGRLRQSALGLELDRLVEHGEAVLVHIFVMGVFVDLELQRRKFRQHERSEAGIDEHLQSCAGRRCTQKFRQLVGHAFHGDDRDAPCHRRHRGERRLGDREAEL